MAQVIADPHRLWMATNHDGYPKHGYCTQVALYIETGQNIACYLKPIDYPAAQTKEGPQVEHYADPDVSATRLLTFLEQNLPQNKKYTLCGYTPMESAEWLDYILYKAEVAPLCTYVSVHETSPLVDVVAFSRAIAAVHKWNPPSHNPTDIHFFLYGDKCSNRLNFDIDDNCGIDAPPILVRAYNSCRDFHGLCRDFLLPTVAQTE